MFSRVCESAQLLVIIFFSPVELVAPGADGEGCMEIDEDIGPGDELPHALHIGMFLCDVTADIPMFFQPGKERGFARAAWPDDTNKGSITWRLHY